MLRTPTRPALVLFFSFFDSLVSGLWPMHCDVVSRFSYFLLYLPGKCCSPPASTATICRHSRAIRRAMQWCVVLAAMQHRRDRPQSLPVGPSARIGPTFLSFPFCPDFIGPLMLSELSIDSCDTASVSSYDHCRQPINPTGSDVNISTVSAGAD